MTTTPCPRCGVLIIRAVTTEGVRLVLDDTPTPDGSWATWSVREGVAWITRAQHRDHGQRLNDTGLRAVHACAGAVGQQMELSA